MHLYKVVDNSNVLIDTLFLLYKDVDNSNIFIYIRYLYKVDIYIRL